MPDWCNNCGEIARLLRWMNDTGDLDVEIAIDVVEKPWHWDNEYRQMCQEQGQ